MLVIHDIGSAVVVADALTGASTVVLMLEFEQRRTILGRGPAFAALFWRAPCRPRVSWIRDNGGVRGARSSLAFPALAIAGVPAIEADTAGAIRQAGMS